MKKLKLILTALGFGLLVAFGFIVLLHILVFIIFHGGNMLAVTLRAVTVGI